MDLLRFCAIGSVDDGKSTLIGRLLADTRQLFEDQVEAVEEASRRRGHVGVDLAFVTDGLRAEREQGITIDVAYRYAATPRRKFIIADCPGHVQYTSNMATGASTANLALVVVDARTGVREQTRRHLCIATLVGVDHLVVAVNKMDLVGWDKATFDQVVTEVETLAKGLGVDTLICVPTSALLGDNVVRPGDVALWYRGPTLIECLESAPEASSTDSGPRFPVQWVLRHPGGGRSYAGMVCGGPMATGDEVVVLPSGARSRLRSIQTFDGTLDLASPGLSVSVTLEDDLDVARGDLLAPASEPPRLARDLDATVCWFSHRPVAAADRFVLKHTTRTTPAVIRTVQGRLDVNAMALEPATTLSNNDIGLVQITTGTALALDDYRSNRVTGSFVLIDSQTHATVAAGMVGVTI